MRGYGGANRWWESYLVRYFMPSIAGVAIVIWLGDIAGKQFSRTMILEGKPETKEIEPMN